MARVKRANGSDKFEPGLWLGKTDRADFHMVATASRLKWTRKGHQEVANSFRPRSRDLCEVLAMEHWVWPNWCKASSLAGKFPTEIKAEEKKLAREEKLKKKEDEARLKGDETGGEKRKAEADEESSKG